MVGTPPRSGQGERCDQRLMELGVSCTAAMRAEIFDAATLTIAAPWICSSHREVNFTKWHCTRTM